MGSITPNKFVEKWENIDLKEISAAQSHFNELCDLVNHKKPVDADPSGEFFTFEAPVKKTGGNKGRADVWYKDHFIMEYKGKHKNLDKAYTQLLLYREDLGNPPLLITTDMRRIIVHTNFTNTVKKVYTFDLEDLLDEGNLDVIKSAFHDPESLRPDQTQEQVTQNTANTFVTVVETLRKWSQIGEPTDDKEKLAHFTVQLLFSLFAEDMKLLPDDVFTKLVEKKYNTKESFTESLSSLFEIMKTGGKFGFYDIPYINGALFDDGFIPMLPSDIVTALNKACRLNWSQIDPSIFGTLFERVIDESKKKQLGAHYTSKEDILLVIEPVLMQPLRQEWMDVKSGTKNLVASGNENEAFSKLKSFSEKLSSTKILDPACGSGNFLYVALQQLLGLQKSVITYAQRQDLGEIPLSVSPTQLYGIELDMYAHELAQITIWIGYLQWRLENGFLDFDEPILSPLKQIENRDAIITYNSAGNPLQSEWPDVDYIIGNPPFLGSRKMRPVLGDEYCSDLEKTYSKTIKGLPDLVCYWFDKASESIKKGGAKRAGLLATQAIRGGSNRQVLQRISKEGGIFIAWSDKEWVLDGAKVHVSIIGFDDGSEKDITLDGASVRAINADLTSGVDLTVSEKLPENDGISFQGVVLRGSFNIDKRKAMLMLKDSKDNKKVVKERKTGRDIMNKTEESYVVDYGVDTPLKEASKYAKPFEHLEENVYPERQKATQKAAREKWWLHWNPRAEMREKLSKIDRYIATPRVAKHRAFVWLNASILPDAQLVVFARQDDYFFGVLHSRLHELWTRAQGTQLRDAESGFRYTSKTTFETFPMPWIPGKEDEDSEIHKEISNAAGILNEFRENWLNPKGVGITFSTVLWKKRTLTNLYNALNVFRLEYKGKQHDKNKWDKEVDKIISLNDITELDMLHHKLDSAVIASYDWDKNISDEVLLERLLELNHARSENPAP